MIARPALSALLATALLALPAAAAESLSLEAALREALASQPALLQAEADLAKARLAVEGARAERFSYSGDVSLGDRFALSPLFTTQSVQAANVPLLNGILQGRLPLFTGFRLTNQIGQADAALEAAESRLGQQRQAVLLSATEAYWSLKRAQLRLASQDAAVAQAERVRRDAEINVTAGNTPANERDRAEVALLNARTEKLRLEAEARLAEATLANALGRPAASFALEAPPSAAPLAPGLRTPDAALQTAEIARPELRAAKANLAVSEAGVAIARADAYPQVDLIGAYQHGNNPFIATSQAHSVLDQLAGTFDVRLNAAIHLFDHGVIRRNVARAEADREAAKAALEAARRSAGLEIRQALARHEAAESRLALTGRAVDLARKTLDYLARRYAAGYALLTEVNAARVDLVTAETNHTDALIDRTLARAALQRATGTFASPAE